MDVIKDSEFIYTYIQADGSLDAVRARFSVPHGAAIDTNVAPEGKPLQRRPLEHVRIPQPGTPLILPKPIDIPFYQDADWQSVTAQAGETLPALIKRAHAEGLVAKGRVMHDKLPKTAEYAWHDWRNAGVRQAILNGGTTPADKDVLPFPTSDATKVQFKGGEAFFLPLKPVKLFEAPVAPGKPGAQAPKATVDLSKSDVTKLDEAIEEIRTVLGQMESLRGGMLEIQARCQGWISDIGHLGDMVFKVHPVNSASPLPALQLETQTLLNFTSSINALLDKAAPKLLDKPYMKISPALAPEFQKQLDRLLELVQKPATIELASRVVPAWGDFGRQVTDPELWEFTRAGTFPVGVKLCRMAALATKWIADVAKVDTAASLLGAAVAAMAKGAPPSSSAGSLIEFAAAMLFYPDDDAHLRLLNSLAQENESVTLSSALTLYFVSVNTAQRLASAKPATIVDPMPQVIAAQDKVLAARGISNWSVNIDKAKVLGASGWGSYKKLQEAYKKIVLGADEKRALQAEDEFAKAKPILEKGGWEGLGQVLEAEIRFGKVNAAEALEALEIFEKPATKFAQLKGNFGTMGALAYKAMSAMEKLANTGLTLESTVAKTEASVEAIEKTLTAVNKLKIINAIEVRESAFMLGRVAVIISVADALFEIAEGIEAHDVWQRYEHLSSAGSSICFAAGGAASALGAAPVVEIVFIAVGSAAFVAGKVLTVVDNLKSGRPLFSSESKMEHAFDTVFPSPAPQGSFEGTCAVLFGLGTEIANVRSAWAAAKKILS